MSEKPKPRIQLRDPNVWIPLALFAGAFLYRLIGITWGLANQYHHQSYHPDELVNWIAAQQMDPSHLNFLPHFYNYGTLYVTVLRVASDMAAAYGGPVDPKDPNSYWAFISLAHLLGRIVTAASGAGMAATMFSIMRRWTSRFGAVSAALLIAVAPGHVVHSRFATPDIFAASLLTLSALFALRLIPAANEAPLETTGVRKNALLSGLFAGLSMGAKYTGLLGLFTLWIALWLTKPKGWVAEGLKGTGACLLAFVVTTPGVILDQAAFMRDFAFEMAHSKTGHGLEFSHTAPGYLYHISNLFVGIGALMTLLGTAGLIYACFRKKYWALALMGFFLPYYVVIGGSEVKFLRYTFPLYVGLAAGFGWVMGAGNRKRGPYGLAVMAGMLGLGGFDSGGLRWSAIDTLQMAGMDARDAAGSLQPTAADRYAAPTVDFKGRTVGLASDPWFWTASFYPDTALPRTAGPRAIFDAMSKAQNPKVVRSFYPSPEERYDWDTHLITDLKPDFISFSNYETSNLERMKKAGHLSDVEKLEVQRYTDFAAKLNEDYVSYKQYGFESAGNPAEAVPDMMYVLPEIWIWKRKDLP